jgi:hypothetical protein
MRSHLYGVIGLVALATGCGSDSPSSPSSPSLTISDYRSVGYTYLVGGTAGTIATADTAGWAATGPASPPWQSGASAPFGDNAQYPGACSALYYSGGNSGGTFLIKTAWPAAPTINGPTSDLLVTKSFALASPGSVEVDVAVDNDIQVFVDGNDITSTLVAKTASWQGLVNGFQTHGDCAEFGSGTFTASGLGVGTHLLALHAKDRGGVTYLDAKVYTAP